jgi:hypothetical protein
VDAAAAGDTVSVAPGTYRTIGQRPVTSLGLISAVVFMKDAVTVAASAPDPALTVIDAGGSGRGVVFANATAGLNGFTVRGGFASDFFGGGGISSVVATPTIS